MTQNNHFRKATTRARASKRRMPTSALSGVQGGNQDVKMSQTQKQVTAYIPIVNILFSSSAVHDTQHVCEWTFSALSFGLTIMVFSV